ncbi:MAG: hypothetical protein V2A79_10740 [Planctomycetota bacterium]
MKGRVFPGVLIVIPRTRELEPGPYTLEIARLKVPFQTAVRNALKLVRDGDQVKDPKLIVDEDRCQRGPNGRPLVRVTPGVPYLTRKEWEAKQDV